MKLDIYQVDAFANSVFEGNPAAVCPLQQWLPDDVMQNIAAENNLAETAFFTLTDDEYYIRWFTPTKEVRLCGHATLASAHILFTELGFDKEEINFNCLSGKLSVKQSPNGYTMDFPAQPAEPCDMFKEAEHALGKRPIACLKQEDYMLIYEDEDFVRNVKVDISRLKTWGLRGVIITSKSTQYDFISRFFAPNYGVDEDPVTGSSFTQLIPYWANELGKTVMAAKQVSRRGGEVHCEFQGNRVLISGQCINYLSGTITI